MREEIDSKRNLVGRISSFGKGTLHFLKTAYVIVTASGKCVFDKDVDYIDIDRETLEVTKGKYEE